MPRTLEVIDGGVTFLFEEDETGGFAVSVPGLPGCLSQGDTLDDALANIEEALALYVEVAEERGTPLPARFSLARAGTA